MSPIVAIIIGIVCKAYSSVGGVFESTLVAMGIWTLKRFASIIGFFFLFYGIVMLLAGAS